MKPEEFEKHPLDNYPIEIDFSAALPTGETIASADATAILIKDRSDASSVVLDGTPMQNVSGTTGDLIVQAGTKGADYEITITGTTSGGWPIADTVIMRVRS